MPRQRIVYLDWMRLFACAMVVLMHSPSPEAGVPGYIQVPLYFLTAPGLVLFFMVSGALLLPVRGDTFGFLRHRIAKIIAPLLFWSAFYIAERQFLNPDVKMMFHEVASLPFMFTGDPVMWFLYTLLGLYLLAPIVSPYLMRTGQKEIRFYLLLWGVTLLYPWLKMIVEVDGGTQASLYYFTGYAGYFIFGYYLHTYNHRVPISVLALSIILPTGCMLLYKGLGGEGFYPHLGYLGILVAVMAFAWYEAIRRFSPKNDSKLLSTLSNCSFGVYLVHIFIMRSVLWRSDFIIHGMGPIGQVVATWLCTLVISFIITWAVSFVPYSEYIIGFSSRKRK